MTLTEEVENTVLQLRELQFKSDADEALIILLKQQNEQIASELSSIKEVHEQLVNDMEKEYEKTFLNLRHERDVAVRKAKEVEGLINRLGQMALEGINRMRGDESDTSNVVEMATLNVTRLPPVELQ